MLHSYNGKGIQKCLPWGILYVDIDYTRDNLSNYITLLKNFCFWCNNLMACSTIYFLNQGIFICGCIFPYGHYGQSYSYQEACMELVHLPNGLRFHIFQRFVLTRFSRVVLKHPWSAATSKCYTKINTITILFDC